MPRSPTNMEAVEIRDVLARLISSLLDPRATPENDECTPKKAYRIFPALSDLDGSFGKIRSRRLFSISKLDRNRIISDWKGLQLKLENIGPKDSQELEVSCAMLQKLHPMLEALSRSTEDKDATIGSIADDLSSEKNKKPVSTSKTSQSDESRNMASEKLSSCQQELENANKTIEGLKFEKAQRMESDGELGTAETLYNELYLLKDEEVKRKRSSADADAAVAERDAFRYVFARSRVLLKQNELAKAEELTSSVWKSRKSLLGRNHSDTRAALEQLSSILRGYDLGSKEKWDEAEKLNHNEWKSAVSAKRRETGDKWVLKRGYELGMIYSERGKFNNAYLQHDEVFKDRERVYGLQNETTLESAWQVVVVSKKLNNNNEALDILDRIWRTKDGELAGLTLRCANELCDMLYDRQEDARVQPVLKDVWLATKNIYGSNSASAVWAGYKLARTLHDLDKNGEAEQILEGLLNIKKNESLVDDYPADAAIRDLLVSVTQALENWPKAEKLARFCWEVAKKEIGVDSPRAAWYAYKFGRILHDSGKKEEAERVLEGLLEMEKIQQASDYPPDTEVQNLLLSIHQALKHWPKAEELARLSWKQAKEDPAQGPDGLVTLHRAAVLALVLFKRYKTSGPKTPQVDEAIKFYNLVFAKRTALREAATLQILIECAKCRAARLQNYCSAPKRATEMLKEATRLEQLRNNIH